MRTIASGVLCLVSLLAMAGAVPGQEPLPPIQKVQIGRQGEFRVNGQPFIPIEAWLQTPKDFPMLRELGFNAMAGYWWDKAKTPADQAAKGILQYAEQVHQAGMYFVSPYEPELAEAMKALAAKDYLLGWTHDDEPELPRRVDPNIDRNLPAGVRYVPRQTPQAALEKYRRIKEFDPMRPVEVGFTACFMSTDTKYTPQQKKAIYPEFLKASDAVGYDTYPIFGSAWPGHLNDVGLGVKELRELAGGGRGLCCAIETNKGSRWVRPAKQIEVRPQDTRFEVWSALICGATGISYFTHSWVGPDGNAAYSTFAPDEAMRKELKRLNAQIDRLTPALVGPPAKAKVDVQIAGGLSCLAKATEADGAISIFAANTDLGGKTREQFQQFEPISPRAGKATITVEGLKAGAKIEVVDENRTLTAEEGKFTDEFGPLAEHVYRIAEWK